MTHNLPDTTRRWLAPITPAVVVSVCRNELPRITEISPGIAAWLGRSPHDLIGHPLSEVFDDVIPGLAIVAQEVSTSGNPVRDYRLSFEDNAGVKRTVCVHAGLRPEEPESGDRIVALRLEEIPVGSDLAEAESEITACYGLVGRSAALLRVIQKIEIYGPTEASVMITGETGTGKELAARAIHACSRRRHKPFLAVNCSTLTGELLESELFGHEKGAFTGAQRTHRGRFERAQGGTLFLDEIGDMPLTAQAKLLRVLEEGMIERVGGERLLPVDVRLVAATNTPLERAVQAKQFRLDLYHRLEVLRLRMPSLRERPEDIPALVTHYLREFNRKYHRQVHRLTTEAIALLQSYPWPGNVRELRNVLERVYVETRAEIIGRRAFEEWQSERSQVIPGSWDLQSRRDVLAARPVLVTPYHGASRALQPMLPDFQRVQTPIDLEPTSVADLSPVQWSYDAQTAGTTAPGPKALSRERIEQAYRYTGGNITQAARYLGVHRATLYRRMKALNMTRDDLDAATSHPDVSEDGERRNRHARRP